MVTVYRLCSSRFSPRSGVGAALKGQRWNPPGIEVVYTAATRSLAALEVLVHFSVLPRDYVSAPVHITEERFIKSIEPGELPLGWNVESPGRATQEYGRKWIEEAEFPVLRVPSCIIPQESNYVLNVHHPEFSRIAFLPSEPFVFDPRLKTI